MSTPSALPLAARQAKWDALWRALLTARPPDPPPNKETTGGEPVVGREAA